MKKLILILIGIWTLPTYAQIPVGHFDINSGQFYAEMDPKKLGKLLELAARYGEKTYGQHLALLELVADKRGLAAGTSRVRWMRAYHLSPSSNLISLREWLTQSGINVQKTLASARYGIRTEEAFSNANFRAVGERARLIISDAEMLRRQMASMGSGLNAIASNLAPNIKAVMDTTRNQTPAVVATGTALTASGAPSTTATAITMAKAGAIATTEAAAPVGAVAMTAAMGYRIGKWLFSRDENARRQTQNGLAILMCETQGLHCSAANKAVRDAK